MPIPRGMEGRECGRTGPECQQPDGQRREVVASNRPANKNDARAKALAPLPWPETDFLDDYGAATQALITPTFESTHQSLLLEACFADIV